MPATDDRAEIIATARELDSETFIAESGYSGPGRLEGAADRELTVALSIIVGHGFADAQAGSVEYGNNLARVGRHVLVTDGSGFIVSWTFATDDAAQSALDSEDESQNPDDDDDYR